MARDFDRVDDNIAVAASVVSGYPFTMACFFNLDRVDATQTLIGLADVSEDNVYYRLAFLASGDDIIANVRNTSSEFARTIVSASVDTWHHACGVFISDTSRDVYIDAAGKGSDVNSVTFAAGTDKTAVGVNARASNDELMSGFLAEVGIWNVELTLAEIQSLSGGFSPLLIRPSALVFHLNLIRDILDYKGNALTITGTTVVAHPQIRYPASRSIITEPAAAAAGTSFPPWKTPITHLLAR